MKRTRFCAIKDETHVRQVDPTQFVFFIDLKEMFVPKVRGAQQRGVFFAGLLQPQQRPANKHIGRHEKMVDVVEYHAQMETDQTHIMGERHPAQCNIPLGKLGTFGDGIDVRQYVFMCKHDPFRFGGGAGRELYECDILWAGVVRSPPGGDVMDGIRE